MALAPGTRLGPYEIVAPLGAGVMHPADAPVRTFERYVAIGDSSTEGLDDRDGRGGYHGWSRRLAGRIARQQGGLLYANLAIRGRTTREIREQQLEPALAMRPDLATVFSGTNDVLARRFDPDTVGADMEAMQRALIGQGATVLTFTLPDLAPLMPIARLVTPRIAALNAAMHVAASRSGAILLDFAAYPVGSDARLWSDDRIHANAAGHARIADALAFALGLPDTSDAWRQPLPPLPPRSTGAWWAGEFAWTMHHLLPWMVAGLGGAGSRRATEARHARLEPVTPEI